MMQERKQVLLGKEGTPRLKLNLEYRIRSSTATKGTKLVPKECRFERRQAPIYSTCCRQAGSVLWRPIYCVHPARRRQVWQWNTEKENPSLPGWGRRTSHDNEFSFRRAERFVRSLRSSPHFDQKNIVCLRWYIKRVLILFSMSKKSSTDHIPMTPNQWTCWTWFIFWMREFEKLRIKMIFRFWWFHFSFLWM